MAAHPGKTRQPAAAVQPHQQRFGLIIGVMCGRDCAKPVLCGPACQRGIACVAGLGHAIAGGKADAKRSKGNAAFGSDPAYQRHLAGSLGPQAMIDARHRDPARQHFGGKQHQRQTVGPA